MPTSHSEEPRNPSKRASASKHPVKIEGNHHDCTKVKEQGKSVNCLPNRLSKR